MTLIFDERTGIANIEDENYKLRNIQEIAKMVADFTAKQTLDVNPPIIILIKWNGEEKEIFRERK